MTTFRGPFADVEIPTTRLPDFVLEHAAARADRPALIDGPSGRTLTYGALASGVQALASGLAERGFAPGEVVALFAPNLPEYAVAFHGVLTELLTYYSRDELRDMVEQELREVEILRRQRGGQK